MTKKTTKDETVVSKMSAGDIAAKYEVPESITVKVGDNSLVADLREFQSGSKGYFVSGKVVINGRKCQVSGSIVLVKSKDD